MVKAIVFDWGGVLIDDPANGLDKYCANVLNVDVERYNRARKNGFDQFAKGDITEDEFWKIVCDELGVDIPKVKSLWGDAVKKVFSEKRGMFDLIDDLKIRGYKIGFLSNTEMPAVKYWKKNDYAKYFDEAVFSCIEHIAKPEPEIYQLMCKRLNLLPNECIFIDDKIEYVNGAKKIGMNGIVFKDYKQFYSELGEYLSR